MIDQKEAEAFPRFKRSIKLFETFDTGKEFERFRKNFRIVQQPLGTERLHVQFLELRLGHAI